MDWKQARQQITTDPERAALATFAGFAELVFVAKTPARRSYLDMRHVRVISAGAAAGNSAAIAYKRNKAAAAYAADAANAAAYTAAATADAIHMSVDTTAGLAATAAAMIDEGRWPIDERRWQLKRIIDATR